MGVCCIQRHLLLLKDNFYKIKKLDTRSTFIKRGASKAASPKNIYIGGISMLYAGIKNRAHTYNVFLLLVEKKICT